MKAPAGASAVLISLLVWLAPAPAWAAQGGSPAHTESLLWRVSRADVPPSYLFGTIHVDDPRVLALPDKVRHAFQASDRLLTEAQMTPETVQAMFAFMVRDDGSSLREALGERLYKEALAPLAGRGIPGPFADRLKTWAAAVTLLAPRNPSGRFLDLVLQQTAREQGMPVHGLESVEEQLGGFDRLTETEQRRLLEITLELLPDLEGLYNAMIDEYLEEDVAELVRLSEQGYEAGDGELSQRLVHLLIDGRNRTMVQNMQPMLEKGGAFVAVGALHLPGEGGIVGLLKKRGYTVEPVLDKKEQPRRR